MLVNKVINSVKKTGIKETFKKGIKKILGNDKYQEQIDTLYYFLNNYTDITSLGPTKDEDLRMVQLCCTEFLAIFDAICEKYKLTYWLEAGTLLGAIRHNGFIPWDDDLDVAMPREDYDKLMDLTKEELNQYNIIVRSGGYFDDRGPMERLALAYKTLETGCWIDVFPVDHIDSSAELEEVYEELRKKCIKFSKIYYKIKNKNDVKKNHEHKKTSN